jgi:peroxiredoxin Q/BCP
MKKSTIALCMFGLVLITACATQTTNRQTGDAGAQAPDFTLPDQNGTPVSLSGMLKEYRGVVLAFYPKDDSRY